MHSSAKRAVALNFVPQGIGANAICLGHNRTRNSPSACRHLHLRQIAKTMLRRIGEPHAVGWAALFLDSDVSSYITGNTSPVNGGWKAS
jgi:3-oxoacyl-[acyl-carrier protein] reductase